MDEADTVTGHSSVRQDVINIVAGSMRKLVIIRPTKLCSDECLRCVPGELPSTVRIVHFVRMAEDDAVIASSINDHPKLQAVSDVADAHEPEEAPPGTDTAPESPGAASSQRNSGTAETSYAQQTAYWQHSAYHSTPVYASGWYYQDVSGFSQGPFTKQQLQLWRQHLPMDLLVWFIDQNGGSSHSLELAKVLGDGRLLERWRKAHQTTVEHKTAAPSATTYELEVSKASASSSSWADAALAGLPPDDEAVQMAELAATAGRSIEDVMQFTYGAEASLKRRRMQDGSTEYTVVARHNPLTGRIEAETGNEDAEREAALYRECASWCNPAEYEKYIAQRSKDKDKDKGQPPKNWKVLRERRLQVKQKLKKQANDWLRN